MYPTSLLVFSALSFTTVLLAAPVPKNVVVRAPTYGSEWTPDTPQVRRDDAVIVGDIEECVDQDGNPAGCDSENQKRAKKRDDACLDGALLTNNCNLPSARLWSRPKGHTLNLAAFAQHKRKFGVFDSECIASLFLNGAKQRLSADYFRNFAGNLNFFGGDKKRAKRQEKHNSGLENEVSRFLTKWTSASESFGNDKERIKRADCSLIARLKGHCTATKGSEQLHVVPIQNWFNGPATTGGSDDTFGTDRVRAKRQCDIGGCSEPLPGNPHGIDRKPVADWVNTVGSAFKAGAFGDK
ncbi:MAG: hypothetical protein M1814_005664 [Vezdaea aestivalis]|nr:MAG: hypothetical protein M1814_005664 [Vezdaea aestivalis]